MHIEEFSIKMDIIPTKCNQNEYLERKWISKEEAKKMFPDKLETNEKEKEKNG